MQNRLPLPKRIQNAPELHFGLELYYGAFIDLSTCRAVGFAEGPIPWTVLQDYCLAMEIEDEQKEDLFFYVRALDNAYLEHQAKKINRGSKS